MLTMLLSTMLSAAFAGVTDNSVVVTLYSPGDDWLAEEVCSGDDDVYGMAIYFFNNTRQPAWLTYGEIDYDHLGEEALVDAAWLVDDRDRMISDYESPSDDGVTYFDEDDVDFRLRRGQGVGLYVVFNATSMDPDVDDEVIAFIAEGFEFENDDGDSVNVVPDAAITGRTIPWYTHDDCPD